AAQTTLGNIFAGISMQYARPFAPGDKITFSAWQYGVIPPTYPHDLILSGITGTVLSIGFMYTKFIRDDRTVIFIPNGILNQAMIQNHSRSNEKMIKIRLDLDKNIDIIKFKKTLSSIVDSKRTELIGLKYYEIKT